MATIKLPGFTAEAVFDTVSRSYITKFSVRPAARLTVTPQISNNNGSGACASDETYCSSLQGGAVQCCPAGALNARIRHPICILAFETFVRVGDQCVVALCSVISLADCV